MVLLAAMADERDGGGCASVFERFGTVCDCSSKRVASYTRHQSNVVKQKDMGELLLD